MDDLTYQQRANAILSHIADGLDDAYADGRLEELDLQGSVLTIITAKGTTLVVSKHAPTKQIWLASPRLGGLHFIATGNDWQLADGRALLPTLTADLATDGVNVTL